MYSSNDDHHESVYSYGCCSTGIPSQETQYYMESCNYGGYNDDVDELLDVIGKTAGLLQQARDMNFTPRSSANSSPSPPDRSQRPRKWNLSSQNSRNVYCEQSMTPYLEPGASDAIAAERFDDDTWLDGHNTGRESHLLGM